MTSHPPDNWSDVEGWDRYLREQLPELPAKTAGVGSLRFARFIVHAGGRVWFPGCGVDPGPVLLAAIGCDVTATDLSGFAIDWQRGLSTKSTATIVEDWDAFLKQNELESRSGQYHAERQDFLETHPDGPFDVIVSQRAFSQLEPAARIAAARNFERSLRPNGHLVVDTLNVQGDARNVLEESLLQTGFFIPGPRKRNAGTAIDSTKRGSCTPWCSVGRSFLSGDSTHRRRPNSEHSETKRFSHRSGPNTKRWPKREDSKRKRRVTDGVTKIAHVVYSTG